MNRTRLGTVLFSAAAIVLFMPACHKKPRVQPAVTLPPAVPAAPPSSLLEVADGQYAEARYAEAARTYRKYLDTDASATDRDRALFRLGMSHALSDHSPQSLREAQAQLESLLMQHSRSPHAAEARFIIELLQQTRDLRNGLRERDDRIADLQAELDGSRKGDDKEEPTRARMLQQELEKLRTEAREKDERIKRLVDELDRLKKIDMERRNPRVP
ncbi:MAG: hypothetical protein HXY20_05735 [Acidobacteria bacterium]|nr:hypothetical protein [Acidobacteriota bacterium]